jgi:preprotein translocase subunit SecE
MRNFLLSLFVLYNIRSYDLSVLINAAYFKTAKIVTHFIKYVTQKVKHFFIETGHFIVAFFQAIWRFLKYITWPFRHALYEYVVVVFFACLFITIKYPEWKWTDYSWLVFFFVMMTALLVGTLRDKN